MGLTSLVHFATLIALRRTSADWRLQAAAGFGMVLAVTLMAAGVIYSNALRETALDHTLRNASDEELNLTVRVFHALERPAFEATRQYVEEHVFQPLSPHVEDTALLIRTSTFYFTDLPQGTQTHPERPRGSLQAITELADHVRVVEGRLPRRAFREVEVAIDPLGASLLGLSIDQVIHAFSAVSGEQESALSVRVVGIIEPLELLDHYWRVGSGDRLTNAERAWISLPMYADRDALFDTVGAALPGLNTDFIWLYTTDTEGLRGSEVDYLRATLLGAIGEMSANLRNSSWRTELDDVLQRYTTLLVLARIPLFLVIFMGVGVLLYYLFLIAGLMGRVRAPEVALFRSRGASTPQVGVIILVEGLLLAVPAVATGPFLAQALVALTGRLFPAASGGQGLATIDLSPPVFLLGAVGALLAVAVLTVTTLSSARHGVVAFRATSARPPQIPFLHRYYLDLALLALIGLLWLQLKSRGSFLVQPLAGGGLEIDITLLLGPVLGMVAAGLLLMRLFPIALRIAARLAEPVGPVWLVHSLRRLARDPVPSGLLLMLLALATAFGALGSNVIATLERSQREQALYEAGADARISYSLGARRTGIQGLAESVALLPGVAAASDAIRVRTRVTTSNFGRDAMLLFVDTESFHQTAWSRADFTGPPMAQALEPIRPAEAAAEGIPLPADATALGIWVQPGRLSGRVNLMARLRDGRGIYFDMQIGQVNGLGWQYLEAPIQVARLSRRSPLPPAMESPYTLHIIWVSMLRGSGGTGAVFLDQLQAMTPQGPVEVESFQSIGGWYPLEDNLTPGLYSLELSEAVARPGRRSAVFTWGPGGLAIRGIRVGPPERPLPALVNPSFLDTNQVQVGDVVSASISVGSLYVPMVVVGLVDYVPTLDPRKTPFMVADLASVLEYAGLHSSRLVYPDREVWVRSANGDLEVEPLLQTIEQNGGTIRERYEAVAMVAARTGDPLLAAGWSGLLALSFLVVVLASASGLGLYMYIDSRERLGEFAVLQALGFSHRQVGGLVWFNLALTVVSGLAVGTWGGQWLGSAVLPLLEVAEGGSRVTPPMVLQNNWSALGLAYLSLAAATLVTVVALAWTFGRLEVQRFLRVAEA